MDRRTFGAGALCTLAFGRATAQPIAATRRIGVLANSTSPSPGDIRASFAPLGRLGWVEGRNLIVERRYANGNADVLRSMAEELVRRKVEIIATYGTDATLAAKDATQTIPIVMRSAGDPVRTGLVASMARPGGNITGYSTAGPELDIKRLSVLRELLPKVERVAWLESTQNPYYRAVRAILADQCRAFGIDPLFVEVANANGLSDALAEVSRRRGHAVFVGSDGLFYDNRAEISRVALERMLPTVVERKIIVQAGALICYSDTVQEMNERFAAFVDRILRGAMPRDLPIEQPTKFELILNLKTAKALNIAVPQTLLVRADQLIQ
jgi:putative tryptophan/tyrosine transport system substrate-binding protein